MSVSLEYYSFVTDPLKSSVLPKRLLALETSIFRVVHIGEFDPQILELVSPQI